MLATTQSTKMKFLVSLERAVCDTQTTEWCGAAWRGVLLQVNRTVKLSFVLGCGQLSTWIKKSLGTRQWIQVRLPELQSIWLRSTGSRNVHRMDNVPSI